MATPAGLLVLVVLVAIGTTGCGSLIPPAACPAALLEGTLVRDDDGRMAVHNAEVDVTHPVDWPDGWSATDVDGVLHLFNGGEAVGREGDRFSAGGGFTPGPREVFEPCGEIGIVPGQ